VLDGIYYSEKYRGITAAPIYFFTAPERRVHGSYVVVPQYTTDILRYYRTVLAEQLTVAYRLSPCQACYQDLLLQDQDLRPQEQDWEQGLNIK